MNLPPSLFSIFIRLNVEKTGSQIETGSDTVAGEDTQGVVEDTGTGVIDGAQLVLN